MVNNWFRNNTRVRVSKPVLKLGKTWTLAGVGKELYGKQIAIETERLSGGRPGSKEFLASYSQGWANVREWLSEEQLAELTRLAGEWNASPPKDIQAK